MRRLKIEFDRFMAGALDIPPEELRFRVNKHLQEMRRQKLRSFAQRFRLGTLEASFNTMNELHARRLREVEQGKRARSRSQPTTEQPNAERGFVLESAADKRAVEALYQKLYGAAGRQKKADFGTFEKHVATQIARLQKKTGCDKVHLRVSSDGDTLKLKAKPIRAEA